MAARPGFIAAHLGADRQAIKPHATGTGAELAVHRAFSLEIPALQPQPHAKVTGLFLR
jgi:hypothetical protein